MTHLNAPVRGSDVVARVEAKHAAHLPMLKWMCQVMKDRIDKGRVVLLENGASSDALELDSILDLEGHEDGIMDDAFFEFIVLYQCYVRQGPCGAAYYDFALRRAIFLYTDTVHPLHLRHQKPT